MDTNIRSQMRKGILEYCVLLLLSRGRAYPSDIAAQLGHTSFTVVEGTLYALLNRLRKEEKLAYEWEESPKGPPRKYYFLTAQGRRALAEMSTAWTEIETSVRYIRDTAAQDTAPAHQEPEPGTCITDKEDSPHPDHIKTETAAQNNDQHLSDTQIFTL